MAHYSTGTGPLAINKEGTGHTIASVTGEIYAIKTIPGEAATPECVIEITTTAGEEITINKVDKPILAKPRVAVSTPEHASLFSDDLSERPKNFGPLRFKIKNAKPETMFEGFIIYYEEQ